MEEPSKAVVHPSTSGATGPVRADRGKNRRLGPGKGKGKGNTPPVGIARAENPRTPVTKGGYQGFRADSLEAIEMMADAEVHSAKISGSSKKRVAALVKAGKEYIQAKRQVLRDSFNRWVQHTPKAAKRPRSEWVVSTTVAAGKEGQDLKLKYGMVPFLSQQSDAPLDELTKDPRVSETAPHSNSVYLSLDCNKPKYAV
uniref:Uncharacterized protein n=1 Tax=Rhodnius prolixus TaxID=13249 RepID=T1HGU9_RHOPR